jgi:hypothetical protein
MGKIEGNPNLSCGNPNKNRREACGNPKKFVL